MRTLVAGSSGMIGSNIVHLVSPCAVADLKDGIDLRDSHSCRSVMRGIDIVYDCAAPTRGIGSHDFMDTAVIPLNILSAKPKHYVYASSSCVYPDDVAVPTNEGWGLFGEPEAANHGYGWAKRVGELACKYSGVPCTIVRLPNIYGPSYDWEKSHKHVIPSLIEKMLRRENPLIVWGSGKQTRSFMYEEDCARLMVALSTYEGTFNLDGWETSISELVTTLAEVTDYKGKIVYDATKPEGPLRKCLDATKMRKVLGARKPGQITLRDGLEKTVEKASDSLRNYRTVQSAH